MTRVLTCPPLLERLLYKDSLMLVIDKPAGIPVHAGPGGGPNLEQGFDDLLFGLPRVPALAHRLDRDTSGCLILGRHRKALQKLGKLFQQSRIAKTYLALVPAPITTLSGTIDAPLNKVSAHGGWKMRVTDDAAEVGAQTAVTDYTVLGCVEGISLVRFAPRTGRTHQLRVHTCHAFGVPILGDTLYGTGQNPLGGPMPKRLFLHAETVSIPLYPSREAVDARAPLPPEFIEYAVTSSCQMQELV